VGPFRDLAGGIDLSLLSGIVTAAVLYVAALWIFPEPEYCFGPEGPRLVPSRPGTPQPIEQDHRSAAARAALRRARALG
jgi:hypothetical protein